MSTGWRLRKNYGGDEPLCRKTICYGAGIVFWRERGSILRVIKNSRSVGTRIGEIKLLDPPRVRVLTDAPQTIKFRTFTILRYCTKITKQHCILFISKR